MKGIKRKVVDTKEEEQKIKKETSQVSEFSEEDDDKDITFADILQDDVFEKAQGDSNGSKAQNGQKHERNGSNKSGHDGRQEGEEKLQKEASREEKTGSKEKSSKQEESVQETKEVIHFKHGIPKEISVFVSAKVTTLPYENIDISTGITLTLPHTTRYDIVTETRDEAYAYCEAFIAEKVAEIRKSVAGAKK